MIKNDEHILDTTKIKNKDTCVDRTGGWIVPETWKVNYVFEDKLVTDFKSFLKEKINNKNINTLFKKYLENEILQGKVKPKYPLNKSNMKKLIGECLEKFTMKEFVSIYSAMNRIGFLLGTIRPASFSIESLELPEKFKKRKTEIIIEYEKKLKKLGKDKAIIWVDKEFDKLTKEVIKYWEDNNINIADIIGAKARGGPADIRKMVVAVGLSINSKGEINDVILNSHIEGLDQTQFFNYSSQGIQALYAKSSETAVPGYLIRKLSTIVDSIVLSKETTNCRSNKYLEVTVFDEDVLTSLIGRVTDKNKVLSEKDTNLIGKKIKIRSPLYCKAKDGICETCFNKKIVEKFNLKPGDNIGTLITTNLGSNVLVNLTLKKSHVGISLNLEEVDLEKDIFLFAE